MGKFITTTEISSIIEKMIKESNELIIFVTPYIKIPSRLKSVIERKLNSSNIELYIICRSSIDKTTNNWFNSLGNRINIIYMDELHAKCYLNENNALVTSMNLYDFSMVNNIEFGVLFDKELHAEGYLEIYEEVCNMGIGTSKLTKYRVKVDLSDVIKETGAIDLRFNIYGPDFEEVLELCYNSDVNKVLPIQIDNEIQLTANDQLERMKELINNYRLYHVQDNNLKYLKFFKK